MNSKCVCRLVIFLLIVGVSTRAKADRPTSIVVNPAAGVYGGATSLEATLSSGSRPVPNRKVTFGLNRTIVGTAITDSNGVATLNNVSLAGIQANTYLSGVRASFPGDNNLEDSRNFATLTVNPAPATVTPNAAGKIYGTADPLLIGGMSGFLPADTVTATYSRTAGETVGGGPYIITAVLGPADVLNNYSITYNTANFTISRAPAKVTPTAASKTAGSPDPVLTGSLSGFMPADGVTATYSRTAGETAAGSPYLITATLSPAAVLGNYSITYDTANFTISPATLLATVTPNAATKVYGAADPPLTGTLSGFLPEDNVTVAYSRTAGESVSSSPYTITATVSPAGVASKYSITYNTANFTITRAPATVTPTAASKTAGSPDPVLTGSLSGFMPADGVTATYSRTAGETAAGSPYLITATLSPAAVLGNYSITYDTANFTISPAPLIATVTPNAATKIYGASDPPLTGTLSGFLPEDNVTVTYSRTAGESVSNSPYTITATVSPAGVASKYSITYNTANFTINPAPLTVTVNNAIKLQGQPNPSFVVTYSGLVNGDAPSSLQGTLLFDTDATTTSPNGTYTITPKGLTSPNYTITFVGGTLNVRYAYIIDNNVYSPSLYLTLEPPSAGNDYTDTPPFYTPIKRISDSMHTPDAAAGTPRVVTISTEYSTMSPFNKDNSRLLLVHLSYFALYDGSGAFLNNLPFEINASAEPRWSRTDPNVLYYVSGNRLKQYNAATGVSSVVHTFNEYSVISGRGKSDISFDGDHFVLVGDARYVFVYELSTDSKGNDFDSAGVYFNNVAITPNNNVIIAWSATGTLRRQGLELFDRNLNFLRQVAHSDGHSDLSRDANGDEVLVWTNANDPMPVCNNGVVKIRLADASQSCLATFDWSLAMHISGTDNSGWVFVETYAPGNPLPQNGWFRYTNELLQIKLDGSQVRRFAHHRSRPFNSYSYQPKLAISRDGKKLAYTSNFGLQQLDGLPTEYSDAYTIDLSVISPDSVGSGL